MSDRPYNVLFLCTGNSARSILAECALRHWGADGFSAYSAGSRPQPQPHPVTLKLLADMGYDTASLRSKSWDEFALPTAPPLDFVFTVCDNARGEQCPAWPGQPMTAHWGVEDPAAYSGPEDRQYRLFRKIYFELETRIKLFTQLPIASLDALSLQARLDEIGRDTEAAV